MVSKLAQIQTIKIDFNKWKIIIRTLNYKEAITRKLIEITANKDISCNDALSYDTYGVWKDILHNR